MKKDQDECFKAGVDDYVPKPIQKVVLAAMLEKWSGDSKHKPAKISDHWFYHLLPLSENPMWVVSAYNRFPTWIAVQE
jgi:YesN/AraC family two-component response regulator